jgi:hypothetical protein
VPSAAVEFFFFFLILFITDYDYELPQLLKFTKEFLMVLFVQQLEVSFQCQDQNIAIFQQHITCEF